MEYPKRKKLRLSGYDYSSRGRYFVTICVFNRQRLLWENIETERNNQSLPLSHIGMIVDCEIQKLCDIYKNVTVEKYCIMPDHIHLLICIANDEDGRTQFAPTLPRIIKQFKGSITKQIGKSIWQKSYMEHVIRNEKSYIEISKYIDENPLAQKD